MVLKLPHPILHTCMLHSIVLHKLSNITTTVQPFIFWDDKRVGPSNGDGSKQRLHELTGKACCDSSKLHGGAGLQSAVWPYGLYFVPQPLYLSKSCPLGWAHCKIGTRMRQLTFFAYFYFSVRWKLKYEPLFIFLCHSSSLKTEILPCKF